MRGTSSDAIAAVRRTLRAVRWRWRGRTLLVGLLLSAVVAFGSALAVRLAARFVGLEGSLVVSALDGTLIAVILGVGATASVLVAAAFAPSIAAFALRADARFEL